MVSLSPFFVLLLLLNTNILLNAYGAVLLYVLGVVENNEMIKNLLVHTNISNTQFFLIPVSRNPCYSSEEL